MSGHGHSHTPKPLEMTANGHEEAFCRGQLGEARQSAELINGADVRITECKRENNGKEKKKKKR